MEDFMDVYYTKTVTFIIIDYVLFIEQFSIQSLSILLRLSHFTGNFIIYISFILVDLPYNEPRLKLKLKIDPLDVLVQDGK